jgi:hypothetical protein
MLGYYTIGSAVPQDATISVARTALASFGSKVRALPSSSQFLNVADPVEFSMADVAVPTPYGEMQVAGKSVSTTLLWPHAEYIKAKAAWTTLAHACGRTGHNSFFMGQDQDTPTVIAERVDALLKETAPAKATTTETVGKTSWWMWPLIGVGAIALAAAVAVLPKEK